MISQATIHPADPARFLKKLCHHFSLKVPSTYDTQKGHVEFPAGVCDVEVTSDGLRLLLEAASQADLEKLEYIVGSHVTLFGKKEQLTAVWTK